MAKAPNERLDELRLAQAIHILEATNAIRDQIADGRLDSLSSEQVFHRIHRMHVGETPETHILASADFEAYPDAAAAFTELKSAAGNLDADGSYTEGAYRKQSIYWEEARRGITGVDPKELPQMAKEVFGKIDAIVQRARSDPASIIHEPFFAVPIAVASATLLDIMHPKRDCNGRTCEDFMYWLEKQLLGKDDMPLVLSDTGLRARVSEQFVKPEYKKKEMDMRERIYGRNEEVLKIKRRLFSDMAEGSNMTEDELATLMRGWQFDTEKLGKQKLMFKMAASHIRDVCMGFLDEVTKSYRYPYEGVVQYVKNKGVTQYIPLTPQQVFRPEVLKTH